MNDTNALIWTAPDSEQTEALSRVAEVLEDPEALDSRKLLYLRHEIHAENPALSELGLAQLGELFVSEPPIGRLRRQIKEEVRTKGLFALRGVPAHSAAFTVGLSMAFGTPVTIGNGFLARDYSPQPQGERWDLSHTELAIPLASASTLEECPAEHLALACDRRAGDAGGELLILHVSRILDRLRPATIETLSDPIFPFPDRGTIVHGQGPKVSLKSELRPVFTNGVRLRPILSQRPDSEQPTIRYRAEAIQAARSMEGTAPLTKEAEDALKELDEVISQNPGTASHAPSPGDVLFLDNRIVLNGRTAISPGSDYRVWRIAATENPELVALDRQLATLSL